MENDMQNDMKNDMQNDMKNDMQNDMKNDMQNDMNLIEEKLELLITRLELLRTTGIENPFDLEMDIMNNMTDFYEQYPSIVKRLCREKNQDNTYLYKMIKLLKQVENGNIDLKDAELSLGNELAEKFVYPVVRELDKNKN
jgi:hypothetical protein